jgi:hypothetical protein
VRWLVRTCRAKNSRFTRRPNNGPQKRRLFTGRGGSKNQTTSLVVVLLIRGGGAGMKDMDVYEFVRHLVMIERDAGEKPLR